MARVSLDTRDFPQDLLGKLRQIGQFAVGEMPIYRACDTLLPAVPRRDPMGMGYVGRNSETELSRWAGSKELVGCTSTTVDCYLV